MNQDYSNSQDNKYSNNIQKMANTLTMDVVEDVAEAIHQGWMDYKIEREFELGQERDFTKKTHPHLVPWKDLEMISQNKDRFQAIAVLQAWSEDPSKFRSSSIPKIIHESWRLSRKMAGEFHEHPHDINYEEAHKTTGPQEHGIQAALVMASLRKIPIQQLPDNHPKSLTNIDKTSIDL